VKANLEAGEHTEFGVWLLFSLGALLLVVREGLPQEPLAVGRFALSEPVEEAVERIVAFEPARELEPDLGEDLEVPARDRLACAADRIEGCVQHRGQAADSRLGLEQAAPQEPTPHRLERMQHPVTLREKALYVVEEILAADRFAGLP